MKSLLLSAVAALVIGGCVAGCANDPIVQERMVITPDTLVFRPPTTDSTISITHTCSCPFSWSATVLPVSDTAWLHFPNYQSGDKSDVPISIDRSLLKADTSTATIVVASNSYGNDSIMVTALR